MSNFFSSLQSYVGPLATFAVGAVIARAMSGNVTLPEGLVSPGHEKQSPIHDRSYEPGEYKPTPADVVDVRIAIEKAGKLPPELLDIIFDQAEYWPHSEATFDQDPNTRGSLRVVGGTPQDENRLLLRCPPVGFMDYEKVGEAFKSAPLPPKSIDGSATAEPLQNLTLTQPSSSPTEPTREARREFFEGSMAAPPALIHPVRKVVFKLRSRDQGWGGTIADKGSYRGSWTWFEAGLEKFDEERKCDSSCKRSAPREPAATENPDADNATSEASNFCTCGLQSVYPPVVASPDGKLAYHHHLHPLDNLKIQANKTATREFLDHEVVWSWTDDIHPESPEGDHLAEIGRGRGTGTGTFIRNLKLGDVITVWGKARFGGWSNYIESVKVEIYWAV